MEELHALPPCTFISHHPACWISYRNEQGERGTEKERAKNKAGKEAGKEEMHSPPLKKKKTQLWVVL